MSAAVCHSIGFKLKPKSLNSTASQDAFVPGNHARSFITQKRPRLSLRCGYSEREHHKVETKPLAPLRRKRQPSLRLRARIRLWRHLMKKLVLKVSFVGLLKFLQRHWRRLVTGGILGCMLVAGCVLLQLSAAYAPKPVPYSTLIESLEAQMVPRVLFEEGSSQIFFNMVAEASNQLEKSGVDQGAAIVEHGSLIEAKKEEPQSASSVESLAKSVDNRARKPALPTWQYCTRKVRHDEAYLLSLLRNGAGKVEYSSAPRSFSSIALSVVGTIVTLWIPLSPVLWLMHRQITGKSDFSKKPRRTVQVVRFEDVAGVDTAKAELWEIVSCLRGQSKFRSLGAKFPKGVLLIGPPGTGKTLLARALAWEAGVPFFAASASEFVEMFVGRGAARIRELFALARKCAPSIVFIDELDAVGGQRGRGFNDERDQTLNQLLTEMDGFESETGVLVLAATNRPEALDPALCRPGRLSRKVYVREPDLEGRKQVLAVHMRGVSVDGDPEAIQRVVAAITPGLAGADLANVVNEAALLAARKGQSAVTLENFKEAVNRAKYGVGQGPSFFSDLERKICAVVETLVPRRGDEKEGYQGVT